MRKISIASDVLKQKHSTIHVQLTTADNVNKTATCVITVIVDSHLDELLKLLITLAFLQFKFL